MKLHELYKIFLLSKITTMNIRKERTDKKTKYKIYLRFVRFSDLGLLCRSGLRQYVNSYISLDYYNKTKSGIF